MSRLLLVLLLAAVLVAQPAVAYQRSSVTENNQAVTRLEKGDYLGGIELLKQAIERQPFEDTIKENLRAAYLAGGMALTRQQRYEAVAELMQEAQGYDDRQRPFWVMRGHALLRMKQFDEAEIDLQEARAMGEPDAQILYLLGQIYYATDRMHEAFDVLESARLLEPGNHGIVQMYDKVKRELAVEREMDKEYGGHFVITFDGGENEAIGREVLDALEESYNNIGSQLSHYPQQRVTVILYTRRQFSELTDSPDWAGGLYDGKIRLPVGGITSVNAQVRALLAHEFMHVVLRDIAGSNLPTWLNEGLAEMAEREHYSHPLQVLPLARQQQKFFALKSLEGSFRNLGGTQATLAYEQSYDFVRMLIDDFGWYKIADLLQALGRGEKIAAAIEEVYGVYGFNSASLEQRWRAMQ